MKLNLLHLSNTQITNAGCAALVDALDRNTLPALQVLNLKRVPASAEAKEAVREAMHRSIFVMLSALAPALRRRPALERLGLSSNRFGDEGLAALVAPPPADAPPPQAEALAQLNKLYLNNTQITDDGCAQLASRLRSGALPALKDLRLDGIPASGAAVEAVYEAHADAVHGRKE